MNSANEISGFGAALDGKIAGQFLIIFAVSLLIRTWCYTGLIGSDDIAYSRYAEQIANGAYQLEPHHMAIRYGVLLPVAAVYQLFGAREWTTVVLPLLFSSLTPALGGLFAFILWGSKPFWIAGALLATFPVEVRYGSILVPEAMLQVPLLAGAITFLFAEKRNSLWLGMLSGFLMGLAYLVKEPGAFVVAAFVLFACLRGRWLLAGAVSAGASTIVISELVWYLAQSGDLLFRSHAMVRHNESGMAVDANRDLFYRLFKSYPRMMLLPNIDFGLHSLIAIAGAVWALVCYRSRVMLPFVLWAVLPWLYLNFGSSSFAYYWALPVAPRYISLAYTPLFLLAAYAITSWTATRTKALLGCVVLGFVAIVGVSCAKATKKTGYSVEQIQALREISLAARSSGQQICEVGGRRAGFWKQALKLIAPDVIHCGGGSSVRVVVDTKGLPKIQ